MELAVGVMAYNEEASIGQALESLLSQSLRPRQIIVVSSGSTDRTEEIVTRLSRRDNRIRLLKQERRLGKASAINEFLESATEPILVLCSADLALAPDCLEELCEPFQDPKVGIVASRPIPVSGKSSLLNSVVRLQWDLHHRVSSRRVKFGECIAFRNVLQKISQTSVDEEMIARDVISQGFQGCYAPKALVYNKGPETISDFLKQRRRIHCGHLEMQRHFDHTPASSSLPLVFGAFQDLLGWQNLGIMAAAICLESSGRLLGRWDFVRNRQKHYVWSIASSTKRQAGSRSGDAW